MTIPVDNCGVVSLVDYGVFAPTVPWDELVTIPSAVIKTHLSGDAPGYMVIRLNDGTEYATKGYAAVQNGEVFESFRITDRVLAKMLLAQIPPHYINLSEVKEVGVLCTGDMTGSGGYCLYAELIPDSDHGISMEDFYSLDIQCVYWDVAANLPNNLVYMEV